MAAGSPRGLRAERSGIGRPAAISRSPPPRPTDCAALLGRLADWVAPHADRRSGLGPRVHAYPPPSPPAGAHGVLADTLGN